MNVLSTVGQNICELRCNYLSLTNSLSNILAIINQNICELMYSSLSLSQNSSTQLVLHGVEGVDGVVSKPHGGV